MTVALQVSPAGQVWPLLQFTSHIPVWDPAVAVMHRSASLQNSSI